MSLFHRSPRTYLNPPTAALEIQPPPSKPVRPTSSLMAVLLPLFFTLLGLGLSVAFLATNALFLFFSLPMMIGSGLWGIISYFSERNKYAASIAQRDQSYRAYLKQQRQAIEGLVNEQRRALLDPHPAPDECLRRAGVGVRPPLRAACGSAPPAWSGRATPTSCICVWGWAACRPPFI
jgi:S-DNA-T family DNA segregation ATPase FtsK/SpoIIIE